MIWEELDPKLIVTSLEAEDSSDALARLGELVTEKGYAKSSYAAALVEREKEYPTGLDIDGIGVAIPHVDPSHVNKQAVAIAILKKPVTFIQMGSDDEAVDVQIMFMLAVVDPNAHIDQLQRIFEIIQDKAFLETLMSAKDSEQIIKIIKEKENSL